MTVEAGTSQVVVARCESVDGRPASQVKWVTTANGNATTVSKLSADNTVTISSVYRMVPKPEDNGKDISCVVAHRTLERPDSFPLKLAVQCKKTHTHTQTSNLLLTLLCVWVGIFSHGYFCPFLSAIQLLLTDAPRVTIVGYDNNWYLGRTNLLLICQATANPIPLAVNWKT